MIRMIQSSNAAHAKSYFSDALSKADYYLNDQELMGRFEGKLAERIGLDEKATKEAFFALCENIHPKDGSRLTPRTKNDRTTGYDINFHCPKSASILNALSPDNHVLQAFEESVSETMRHLEADSKTRVRQEGFYEDRDTGELAWASFTHQTARPVEGQAPDPHLHAHCFVFNATWDEEEQRIKAGQFRDIKRDMPYYQARFHKTLSDKLHRLGYQIRRTDQSFEIVGVPQAAIDLFSKRTNEIGEIAKEKGITDARAKSELGARTRAKKQKGLSMSDLRQQWRQELEEKMVVSDEERNQPIRYAKNIDAVTVDQTLNAQDCVDYAAQHIFERSSVIQDRRLLETAYRHSIGRHSVALEEVTSSFNADTRFIHVNEKYRSMCTTKGVLMEEKKMVELARQGQSRFLPLYLHTPELSGLNDHQAAAVARVLTTPHQVSIIRGAAGSGKTTLLQEAKKHINAAGKKVFAVAPTAEASRGVLVKGGFENAETVAKLLASKELQMQLKNNVLVVDEAGLLGTQDMTALLSIAQTQNARLLLVGDTRQHSSVVRGDALRILNTVGGIPAAEVSKILRQKDVHYKAAVEDLSKGDVHAAFIKLSSIGAIKNADPLKPNADLVADYMKLTGQGKSVLVVSPTHQQGNAVTDEIRTKLKATGKLGKKELNALKLTDTRYSDAEKTDWRNYEKGQIVQFSQNVPRIKRGSAWLVSDVSKDAITITSKDAGERRLPIDRASAFSVYRQSVLNLAKGDKVKVTHNGFDRDGKRLNNGQSFTVHSVNRAGRIVLQNEVSKSTYTVGKDFGHLNHAYCTTSHSSQGKTVDEVLISQPSSTFTATDAKQFYVSVSRGKERATIYTDDRQALLEYAAQIGDRQSAMELVRSRSPHEAYVHHLERSKQPQRELDKGAYYSKGLERNREDYEPGF